MLKNQFRAGVLAVAIIGAAVVGGTSLVQPQAHAQTQAQTTDKAVDNDPYAAKINALPMEQLVTATCRQAWHLGGENQDAFFDIVERLTDLSAHNRGITLPDDSAAGARAGQWIRTQALKDPDQLLYAVVDHAVVYQSGKRAAASAAGAKATPPAQ